MRVVFDTNTVVSALLFRGSLAWLVEHWRDGEVAPLVCRETASELVRVLAYPKFGLSVAQADTALAHYLPYGERVVLPSADTLPLPHCRDASDTVFLRLALAGHAAVLVSGDPDLLAVARPGLPFAIESPGDYRNRCRGA